MTFYSIVFGILFIGAVSDTYKAILSADVLSICMSLVLTMAIFSDTIITSHHIEQLAIAYTLKMKLIDLLSFFILSFAIIQLSPADNIFFKDEGRYGYEIITHPSIFWTLMILYWIIGLLWNKTILNKPVKKIPAISILIGVLPAFSFIASIFWANSVHIFFAVLCVVVYAFYLLIYKYDKYALS